MTRLSHLQALEVTYAEMVRGTEDTRWQSLLKYSFGTKDIRPWETQWLIIEVREQFSARAKDIIIVSTLALSVGEER
jgi:hypothetical protein